MKGLRAEYTDPKSRGTERITGPVNKREPSKICLAGKAAAHASALATISWPACFSAGITTLLVDLLGEHESKDRRKVFDIDLLAERLLINASWVRESSDSRGMGVPYLGSSTGAVAAPSAAAIQPQGIAAVVSRGGRPDLTTEHLPFVEARTLSIVGGNDASVVPLDKAAFAQLKFAKEFVIVPRASHLFEEPGTLEKAAWDARNWFIKYFPPHS